MGETIEICNEEHRRFDKMKNGVMCPSCWTQHVNIFSVEEIDSDPFIHCSCYNCNTDFFIEPNQWLLDMVEKNIHNDIEEGYFPMDDY